jgi:hypothetical protein
MIQWICTQECSCMRETPHSPAHPDEGDSVCTCVCVGVGGRVGVGVWMGGCHLYLRPAILSTQPSGLVSAISIPMLQRHLCRRYLAYL